MSRATRCAALVLAAAGVTALTALPSTASADGDTGGPLLRSGLVGSTPSPVGPTLFGVTPGGAPWVVARSRVSVDRDGEFELQVRGLVIPISPSNGTNPLPALSASLFCNGSSIPAATTGTVPFDRAGNASIETTVLLPATCLAPAVLVHPNAVTSRYIAANG